MAPRFTEYVVQNGLLKGDPFRVIDVGARGEPLHWFKPLEGSLETVGFEMDPDECVRLNELYNQNGFRYLPFVLGSKKEEKTFYITNWPFSCGLYKNRVDYWNRFASAHLRNLTVVREVQVITETLDLCLVRKDIDLPDFIKVDVEGAELDVLKGGKQTLNGCLGALVETRFQNASNCPLFTDTDIFMRENGFRLHDFLHLGHYPRRSLPDPRCWADGKEVAWQEDLGQLVWGDALYFADPIECPEVFAKAGLDRPIKLIKFVMLLELFGYPDYAAELINTYPSVIGELIRPASALDLLTPTVNGVSHSYERYVAAAQLGVEKMTAELSPPRMEVPSERAEPPAAEIAAPQFAPSSSSEPQGSLPGVSEGSSERAEEPSIEIAIPQTVPSSSSELQRSPLRGLARAALPPETFRGEVMRAFCRAGIDLGRDTRSAVASYLLPPNTPRGKIVRAMFRALRSS